MRGGSSSRRPTFAAAAGRTAAARRAADSAVALSPLEFGPFWVSAFVDLLDGRFDLALAHMRDAAERLAPSDPFALWWVAQASAYAGFEDEARVVFGRVAKMDAGLWSDLSDLWGRVLDGDKDGIREWFARPLPPQHMGMADEWYPYVLAAGLARAGETGEAVEWLNRAISSGFSNHEFFSRHDRFLAPLGAHPRFELLIERARDAERALEV